MSSSWPGYEATGRLNPPAETAIFDALLAAKGEADEGRREEMERRVDLFEDDWTDHLRDYITRQWAIENTIELNKGLDTSNNICKKIVTDISTIYDEPAAWKLTKTAIDPWKQLRKSSNLDLAMPVLNQYVNLCNECLLRVAVIRGRLRLHVVPPHLFKVWENPDDPTSFDAVAYMQGMVNTTDRLPVWQYWSNGGKGAALADKGKAMHRVVDEKWVYSPRGGGKVFYQVENPYRDEAGQSVIPAVAYHRELPVSRFFNQTHGRDLYDGTLMIGALETLMNLLHRTSSVPIKWVNGEIDSQASGQVVGPTRLFSLRSKGDAPLSVGQWDANANWAGLRQNINDKIDNVSTNYGLSRGALQIDGTPQSGFSLKVRKEPLLEARKRQIPLYQHEDRELYGVIAAVWNFERANAAGDASQLGTKAIGAPLVWPSMAEPEVTYSHVKEPMTAQEEETVLSLNQARLSMGLTNVIELYQAEHLDTTEEDARAAIEENNKINRELASGTQLVVGRAQILQVTPPKDGVANPTMTAPGTTNPPPKQAPFADTVNPSGGPQK